MVFLLSPIPVDLFFDPGGIAPLGPLFERALSFAFLGLGTPFAFRLPFGRLMIQRGIPAQARHHRRLDGDTTPAQSEGSQAPIDDQHQRMLGPPATHLLDHLANPIQAGFVTRRIPTGILFLGPTGVCFFCFFFFFSVDG